MILIIGASSGVGLELVKIFQNNNSNIATISRKKINNINNKNLTQIKFDITNNNYNLLHKVIKKKSIDAVIFTVGFVSDFDNLSLNLSEIDKIYQTNFISVTQFVKFLINNKKLKDNSTLSFCSSVTTFLPRDIQIFYCASKRGLDSFIDSLRFTFLKEKTNIYVNKFVIGVLDSPMKGSKRQPSKMLSYKKTNAAKCIFKKYKSKNKNFYVPFWWFFIKIIILLFPYLFLQSVIKKITSK